MEKRNLVKNPDVTGPGHFVGGQYLLMGRKEQRREYGPTGLTNCRRTTRKEDECRGRIKSGKGSLNRCDVRKYAGGQQATTRIAALFSKRSERDASM